ncbi:uncharacterized protein LOC141614686 [Silene latifolia]|uniref:uncharacterized protein LOC141614686 n=1 Tax=Silene latifolia TaxID=37657 RepID=UPI003D771886
MFVFPKGIISRIEATCRNFLWDKSADYRRVPLVAWDKVSYSKEEGGLGLKDQETMNKSMIGRLVHWIMEEKDSIWVQWVKKNYLKGKDWLEYKPTASSSWERKPAVTWYKWIWNEQVTPKHQFMGWLYAHGAMRTKDKLIKYGLDVDDSCFMCEQATESIDHLLCDCIYSRRVMQDMSQKMQISFPDTDMLGWCTQRTGTKVQQWVQVALLWGTVYNIWQ